jgi:OOP family OmpA-OmpF porin
MKTTLIYTIQLFLSLLIVGTVQAQIDVKGKIRDKVLQRADQHVDEGIDKGLDAAEEGIKDAATEDENQQGEEGNNEEADREQESAQEKSSNKANTDKSQGNGSEATKQQPTLAAYSKYDFVPGEKIVFFDDFSQDVIGDFPALWNTDVSGEVVTTNNYPGKWFKLGLDGSFIPGTNGAFPDNFTIEFDLIAPNSCNFGCYIYEAENPDNFNEGGAIPGIGGIKIWFGQYQHDYNTYYDGGYVLNGTSEKAPLLPSQVTRISIWVQKQRIRVYVNETKVFDVIKAMKVGAKNNVVRLLSGSEFEPLISNVRIAAGLPDMRSKLITEGKLVSYGIYFDVNSDKIKPESNGTLKGIAQVLTENPDVKVKIIGHTDSDGDDAKNLDLSKRRSVSVKNELSKSFGIEALRIETDGKGETQPIAPNDSPSNKAQNRRVEFIKL